MVYYIQHKWHVVTWGRKKNTETNKEHDEDCVDWDSIDQGEI